jgi:nitrogen regulatory protein P-II 1
MKLVIAVLRPEQLPAVKEALFAAHIKHFTVSTVLGTASRSEQQMVRGVEREVSLFQRVRIEIAVNEDFVEPAMQAVSAGAMETGGHGKVMVTDLHDVMTVWTGERGSKALH